MKGTAKREALPRLVANVGAFAAFPEILTFGRLYYPDDGFTSDLVNGELPFRVLAGRLVRDGHLPIWTSDLGGGTFLGGVGEPLSLALFALLSPVLALSVLLCAFVTISSQGTYSLSRRLGATPWAAAFSAIAFTSSGYVVSQLRHLAILSTIVWIPVALCLLDRALAVERAPEGVVVERPTLAPRLVALALFGLVLLEQSLSGFPQSIFIAGIAYASYALASLVEFHRAYRSPRATASLTAFGALSGTLGLVGGAVSLLPLVELAKLVERDPKFNWFWVHQLGYAPKNLANFFVPYLYGDASNMTYENGGLFWEVYGYAGLSTALLFVVGIAFELRRPRVAALFVVALFALFAVLGPNLPTFLFLWKLPGMSSFRFWTRFLVLVDLVLALGAGLVLTRLASKLARSFPKNEVASNLSLAFIPLLCLDLFVHQRRQNPFSPADEWLAPNASTYFLAHEEGHVRLHSLASHQFHRLAHRRALGWSRREPYLELLPSLPPNLSVLHRLPSVDLYAGAAPPHWRALFGDHTKLSIFPPLVRVHPDGRRVDIAPAYLNLLRIAGVTHLVSPVPVGGALSNETPAFADASTRIYRLAGARAYFASRALSVTRDEETFPALLEGPFNPTSYVLVDEGGAIPEVPPPSARPNGPLVVEELSPTHLRIDVTNLGTGYVYLADTFYSGWSATLDGRDIPLARGNVYGRAVALETPGRVLELRFESRSFNRGLLLTSTSLCGLLLALLFARRAARPRG